MASEGEDPDPARAAAGEAVLSLGTRTLLSSLQALREHYADDPAPRCPFARAG